MRKVKVINEKNEEIEIELSNAGELLYDFFLKTPLTGDEFEEFQKEIMKFKEKIDLKNGSLVEKPKK